MSKFDDIIQDSQKKIEQAEKLEKSNVLQQYNDTFFAEVNGFRDLAKKTHLAAPEAKAYFEKGKAEVSTILLSVAARGEWLSKHPALTEVPADFFSGQPSNVPEQKKDGTGKSPEKGKGVAIAEEKPHEASDIPMLASSLRSTLSQYRNHLQEIDAIETQLDEALKAKNTAELAEQQLKNLGGVQTEQQLADLSEATGKALTAYEVAQKNLVDHPDLPADFRLNRSKMVTQDLKKLAEQKIQFESRRVMIKKYAEYLPVINGEMQPTEAFKALPQEKQDALVNAWKDDVKAIRSEILFEVEVSIAPKAMESYYVGLKFAQAGDSPQAEAEFKKFQEANAEAFKALHQDPKAAAKRFGEAVIEALQHSEKVMAQLEKISGDHKDFFDGQTLAQQGDMVGAKQKLKKYISEHAKDAEENETKKGNDAGKAAEKKVSYVGTAKELLKNIALTQLEEVKAKFKTIKPPPEVLAVHHSDDKSGEGAAGDLEKSNPAFERYQKYQDALEKAEKMIQDGKYFDISDAYQFLNGPSGKGFDPNDEFNFLGDEAKLDEGRDGLLALARKYRSLGSSDPHYYEMAEDCFRRYFGEKLSKLTKQGVSIEDLRKKYEANPRFQADLTAKVHETKEVYDHDYDEQVRRLGPEWAAKNPKKPWDEANVRAAYEHEALQKIQPAEAVQLQQRLFLADPQSFTGWDQGAWGEFMNMKGMYREQNSLEEATNIKALQTYALSDSQVDWLMQELPVSVGLMAISGGLGGAAGRVAGEMILKAGMSTAAEEAFAFGVSQGWRQAASYAGGLLIENTVFTASSSVMNAVRSGKFELPTQEEFGKEWLSGLKTLGGLGMFGRAGHALHLDAGSSFAAEIASMGVLDGDVTLETVATTLGIKGGHFVADLVKGPHPDTFQKMYADHPNFRPAEANSTDRPKARGPYRDQPVFDPTENSSRTSSPAIEKFWKSKAGNEVPRELWPDQNDPSSAKSVEGWIDQDGIHFNIDYLNEGTFTDANGKERRILPEGFTAKADAKGDLFIETPAGKQLSLKEYESLVRGSPYGRVLLDTMVVIKNHEATHRVLEFAYTKEVVGPDGKVQRVPDGEKIQAIMDLFAPPDANGHVPDGKIPLVDKSGKPLEHNWKNVQEALCEIGDGTRRVSKNQAEQAEKIISAEVPGFSFAKARNVDTKLLARNPVEAFARQEAAAKDGGEPISVPRAPTLQDLAAQRKRAVLEAQLQKIISDLQGVVDVAPNSRKGEHKQRFTEFFQTLLQISRDPVLQKKLEIGGELKGDLKAKLGPDITSAKGAKELADTLKAQYDADYHRLSERAAIALDGGLEDLEVFDKSLNPVEREFVKQIQAEAKNISELLSRNKKVKTQSDSDEMPISEPVAKSIEKTETEIAHDLADLEDKLTKRNNLGDVNLKILLRSEAGRKILDKLILEKKIPLDRRLKIIELKDQIDHTPKAILNHRGSLDLAMQKRILDGEIDIHALNILEKDTRGILTSDQVNDIARGEISDFVMKVLEANIDHPQMTPELVEKIMTDIPERTDVHGKEVRFYDVEEVGVGGTAVVSKVVYLDENNHFKFTGCKKLRPGKPLVFIEGEINAAGMIAEAKDQGLDTSNFMQYQFVSDDGKMVFFDIYEYKDPEGNISKKDLADSLNDPSIDTDALYKSLLGGGKALAAIEQYNAKMTAEGHPEKKLLQTDFKPENVVPTNGPDGPTGVQIDLGTLITIQKFKDTMPGISQTVPDPLNPHRTFFVGSVPADLGFTAGYFSNDLYWKVFKGKLPPEALQTYTFGVSLRGMIKGHLLFEATTKDPQTGHVTQDGIVESESYTPRPLSSPPHVADVNERLEALANKCTDTSKYTPMTEVVKEMEDILNLKP